MFEDTASPQILLSYAASDGLGIVEFKFTNETTLTALDAITDIKKHVKIKTPLHSHTHKQTHSKVQHNHEQLKPVIKSHSFQDHGF